MKNRNNEKKPLFGETISWIFDGGILTGIAAGKDSLFRIAANHDGGMLSLTRNGEIITESHNLTALKRYAEVRSAAFS